MAARPPPRLVMPGPGTHILRDVGGVPGLSVLTEAFTEDCERRYWGAAPGSGDLPTDATKRMGQCHILHPLQMFGAVHEVVSLVEDTGLYAPMSAGLLFRAGIPAKIVVHEPLRQSIQVRARLMCDG